MAKISGILTDGAGQIINDCTIELYAKKTTNNVLTQTQAFTVANDGRYSINAQPCEYDVSLIINGFPKKRIGTINVYSDSVDGSLNDYLINPEESDLTPEFLKQIFDARNEAIKSAIDSEKSAEKSADSANAANASETNAKSSADTAKASADEATICSQSASESATIATNASSSAKSYSDSAKSHADSASSSATVSHNSAQQSSNSANAASSSERNAKTSEQNAKKSADDAKNWASTIDNSNFIKKTGEENQSINGALDVKALTEDGKRVYSPNNKPDADTVGALPVVKIADNEISTYSVDDNVDFKKIPTVGGKSVITDLTDVNNKIELIKTKLGEFRLMPFRAGELPFGWYFRNGDNYLLSSPQGRALNGLSANYKRDHQIAIKNINGQQYINVPSAFAPDGRGYFERPANGTTRQVGSAEDDAIRDIWGHIDTGVVANHHEYTRGAFCGTYAIHPKNGGFQPTKEWDAWGFDFYASRVVPTAHENRPINMGLTPVIYLGV